MIREKEVIRIRVPFPTVSSQLALQAHMYICKRSETPEYEYVKCQRLKPYMIYNSNMLHYVDEVPDTNRNPFVSPSRIDCDKVFATHTVEYHEDLRTTIRTDVCEDLYRDILAEVNLDGYATVTLDEEELKRLNIKVTAAS